MKKSIRKISRIDLMLMLTEQEEEILALKEENERLRRQLEDKNLRIREVGSIAEATIGLSDLFAEAQKTAEAYIDHIHAQYSELHAKESVG